MLTVDRLRVLDLFSGIGGFSLGLEMTGGFETVAFCECEPYPQKILAKHWPNVPIFDDVRTLDYDGPIDVITGGYPCQPFSVAGQRKGAEDDRHLWPAMRGLIQTHRPTWVICENVYGHISMGLDDVLSDLESDGYACQSFVVPACAVDAPHRRDRVWIVAHARHKRVLQQWQYVSDCAKSEQQGRIRRNVLPGGKQRKILANAVRQGLEGQRKVASGISEKHTDTRHTCRWEPEPGVGRVANGVPRRVDRLRGLGNAVVPQVVEQIGYAILKSDTAFKQKKAP